ncbi:MAG: hypothetical protein QNL62_21035 [Gammaproteobacteria bacterium]|nr:hypothetical protein [Gammaproteobacteria bacterium]
MTTFFVTMSGNTLATTIFQCELPDGTIEFTNKGCSKSNSLFVRKIVSSSNTTEVRKKRIKKKNRPRAPFTHTGFINLQNKMLGAQTLQEMEKYAQTIIGKVRTSVQQGKINAAYDMVAATYAKISKAMKKSQWEGQSVAEYTLKIQSLFEEIMITQSTISTTTELNQVIQTAWKNYQAST